MWRLDVHAMADLFSSLLERMKKATPASYR